MIRYLAQRLILAVFTLLLILLVSYVLLRLAPGDPTRSTMLGSDQGSNALDSGRGVFARNQALRDKLHLDQPIWVGFGYWFGDVLHGDFGTSASVDPGRPVTELILDRLPVTVALNVWAVLITYLLAIPLGVYSALRVDRWSDRLIALGLFILYSLPVIWVGLLLQSLFCDGGKFPFFPLRSPGPADLLKLDTWAYLWALFKAYALPVLCLAYGGFAALSRFARNGMLEVIHEDYIRTARAKGLSEFTVIWRHAFRNAVITLITLFGGLLPTLVAGSIIVEYIFNIQGMGSLSMLALSSRDYPLQMALFAFAGILTLGGILLADLLYVAADPRISLTGRRE